jgi:hypothetical protein
METLKMNRSLLLIGIALLCLSGCTKSQPKLLSKNQFVVTKVEMKEDACWITARGINDNGVVVEVRAYREGGCSVVGNVVYRGRQVPNMPGVQADTNTLFDSPIQLPSTYSWDIKNETAQ